MAKLLTLAEKQESRRNYVKASFVLMILIPVVTMGLVTIGIDPSSASGIIATASATFSAVIVGHMATSPKDDNV